MSQHLLRDTSSLLRGFWCTTGHPSIVEAAAAARPEWVCLDTQHGVDLGHLDASLFTVIASHELASLVRVPSLDSAAIGRALDLGATGIVIPLIETSTDAEMAVAATRHAPVGVRSFGMQTQRIGPFDETPYVVLQIETAASIEHLDAIVSVEGVDAVYIGPADLGLGLHGKPCSDVNAVFDGQEPIMHDAFTKVVDTANAAGIRAGLHCGDGESAARAREFGFTMMSVGSDVGLIRDGLMAQLGKARS